MNIHLRASRRSARVVLSLSVALGLASLAVGAGATGAAAALAPSRATFHTREVQLDPDGFNHGTVRCPAGRVAISGGAALHRIGEEPSPDLAAKLVASGPTTSARGWHGAAASFEAQPIQLRLTVVCRPAAAVGPYTVRTKDLALASGHAIGSLACGTGLRMVTGGALWNPGPDGPSPNGANNLLRSTPSPDGKRWLVRGFSYGPEDILRIVLLCRPASSVGPLTIRHRDIPFVEADRGGRVGCGRGRRALSGGVDWTVDGTRYPFGGSLTSTSIRPDGTGWYGAGGQAGEDVTMRLTVVCVAA